MNYKITLITFMSLIISFGAHASFDTKQGDIVISDTASSLSVAPTTPDLIKEFAHKARAISVQKSRFAFKPLLQLKFLTHTYKNKLRTQASGEELEALSSAIESISKHYSAPFSAVRAGLELGALVGGGALTLAGAGYLVNKHVIQPRKKKKLPEIAPVESGENTPETQTPPAGSSAPLVQSRLESKPASSEETSAPVVQENTITETVMPEPAPSAPDLSKKPAENVPPVIAAEAPVDKVDTSKSEVSTPEQPPVKSDATPQPVDNNPAPAKPTQTPDEAALKIQSVLRGHNARKKLKPPVPVKPEESPAPSAPELPDKSEEAAPTVTPAAPEVAAAPKSFFRTPFSKAAPATSSSPQTTEEAQAVRSQIAEEREARSKDGMTMADMRASNLRLQKVEAIIQEKQKQATSAEDAAPAEMTAPTPARADKSSFLGLTFKRTHEPQAAPAPASDVPAPAPTVTERATSDSVFRKFKRASRVPANLHAIPDTAQDVAQAHVPGEQEGSPTLSAPEVSGKSEEAAPAVTSAATAAAQAQTTQTPSSSVFSMLKKHSKAPDAAAERSLFSRMFKKESRTNAPQATPSAEHSTPETSGVPAAASEVSAETPAVQTDAEPLSPEEAPLRIQERLSAGDIWGARAHAVRADMLDTVPVMKSTTQAESAFSGAPVTARPTAVQKQKETMGNTSVPSRNPFDDNFEQDRLSVQSAPYTGIKPTETTPPPLLSAVGTPFDEDFDSAIKHASATAVTSEVDSAFDAFAEEAAPAEMPAVPEVAATTEITPATPATTRAAPKPFFRNPFSKAAPATSSSPQTTEEAQAVRSQIAEEREARSKDGMTMAEMRASNLLLQKVEAIIQEKQKQATSAEDAAPAEMTAPTPAAAERSLFSRMFKKESRTNAPQAAPSAERSAKANPIGRTSFSQIAEAEKQTETKAATTIQAMIRAHQARKSAPAQRKHAADEQKAGPGLEVFQSMAAEMAEDAEENEPAIRPLERDVTPEEQTIRQEKAAASRVKENTKTRKFFESRQIAMAQVAAQKAELKLARAHAAAEDKTEKEYNAKANAIGRTSFSQVAQKEKEDAATKIQAITRGHQGRQSATATRELAAAKQKAIALKKAQDEARAEKQRDALEALSIFRLRSQAKNTLSALQINAQKARAETAQREQEEVERKNKHAAKMAEQKAQSAANKAAKKAAKQAAKEASKAQPQADPTHNIPSRKIKNATRVYIEEIEGTPSEQDVSEAPIAAPYANLIDFSTPLNPQTGRELQLTRETTGGAEPTAILPESAVISSFVNRNLDEELARAEQELPFAVTPQRRNSAAAALPTDPVTDLMRRRVAEKKLHQEALRSIIQKDAQAQVNRARSLAAQTATLPFQSRPGTPRLLLPGYGEATPRKELRMGPPPRISQTTARAVSSDATTPSGYSDLTSWDATPQHDLAYWQAVLDQAHKKRAAQASDSHASQTEPDSH